MNRMRRAAGTLALTALLAACAAPGTGGGAAASGTEAESATSANPSMSVAASDDSAASTTGTTRVDIGALSGDPSAFNGEQIKVLARVDQVLVDGVAFLTSPSASDEGQIAVLVRPDAQVDKEFVEGSVVWVEGTVIGLTEQELSDAGLDISLDELGDFDGEFAIVADAISDPLASSD